MDTRCSFKRKIFILFLSCLLQLLIPTCCQRFGNTLQQGQNISGGELIVSSDGRFLLRFDFYNVFERQRLKIYLVISFVQDQYRPLWIANRDMPIVPVSDKTRMLQIDEDGSLRILPDNGDPIVLYQVENPTKTMATLENNGNFVLRELNPDGSIKQVLWQSFDYPTDTLLPRMKIGIDWRNAHRWSLTSWRTAVLPASGPFTLGVDPNRTNELFIWFRGKVRWTSGEWRNGRFGNMDNETFLFEYYNFSFVSNENETYFSYTEDKTISIFQVLKLDPEGSLPDMLGNPNLKVADCNITNLYYPSSVNSVSGCVRQQIPACRRPDDLRNFRYHVGFMLTSGFKYRENENLAHADCRARCLEDCSCVAHAATNPDGTGCEIWRSAASFKWSSDGREIYFIDRANKWWLWLTISVGMIMTIPAFCSFFCVFWINRRSKGHEKISQNSLLNGLGGDQNSKIQDEEGNELQIFGFDVIAAATDYFSIKNKLGEGGFGPVYKGKLSNGREIAIKRLSRTSGQGLDEFRNEAMLIAKLQHTNLVRLLGLCVNMDEKMLMYEYMSNKSLDCFLFDSSLKKKLDWKKRFHIIEGVAQGLLYLHKYSRLRVIHRDLKASNILLDEEMNPKISDFGLARIFDMRESEANTSRVAGTYGYMSPEYAMNGVVSIKVDVFSFGVLVLEIVSGKKNNASYHLDYPLNLVGYVWQLWSEGRASVILDSVLEEFSPCQVQRCIHIGLLCVQYHATDRPTMSGIVAMLSNETMPLPQPKQPAFFINEAVDEADIHDNEKLAALDGFSKNQVSITVMEPR